MQSFVLEDYTETDLKALQLCKLFRAKKENDTMMFDLILYILGGVIAVILGGWLYFRYVKDRKLTFKEVLKIVTVVTTVLIVFILLANSVAFVDVGYAAVVVDPLFGDQSNSRISQVIQGSAWYLKFPWSNVVDIYYATDSYEDTYECFSSDQLAMGIRIQIRWQLDFSKIIKLYQSYPRLDYENTAIDAIMEKTIKLVTKNYTALETIEFRDRISDQMQQEVFKNIGSEGSLKDALSYLTFDLKDIGYPQSYTASITEKLVKEQLRLAAAFESERIIILANATGQQLVIESQAQARQMEIKADAEAYAKTVVANSTRTAIQLILEASGADPSNATRIAELYLWVETLKQIAPNIDYFFMTTGQDGIPIVVMPSNQTQTPTP